MEHLLGSPWTFYYFQKKKAITDQEWASCIQPIAYVETIENFWAVYSRLTRPSQLRHTQYHFFRNHCRAIWEDEENVNGGIFSLDLSSNQIKIDAAWETLLLGLIGERINPDVNGVVIKGLYLTVWTKTSQDLELRQKIAGQIFTILHLPYKTKICFLPNEKAKERHIFSTTYIYEAEGAKLVPNEENQS